MFRVPKPFYFKGPLQPILQEDMLRDLQTEIDMSVLAILDRGMIDEERFPTICRLENTLPGLRLFSQHLANKNRDSKCTVQCQMQTMS